MSDYYDDPDLANDIAVIEATKDFTVQNEGTIFLFKPHTPEASAWAKEHLPDDCPTWGIHAYVIEHRYIAAIVEGAREAGFTIGDAS